jgi:hypothetical protein
MYYKNVSRTAFSVAQQPICCLGRLVIEVYRSHSYTRTPGRTHLNECPALRRGHCLYHTEQTQQSNIHVLSGIRTHVSGNRAAEDLRLRPHGPWVQTSFLTTMKCSFTELCPRLFWSSRCSHRIQTPRGPHQACCPVVPEDLPSWVRLSQWMCPPASTYWLC